MIQGKIEKKKRKKKKERKKGKTGTREVVDEEDDDEHGETMCGACGENYVADEFWICCDICEKWFHGKQKKEKKRERGDESDW